jgi:hypothetical protein
VFFPAAKYDFEPVEIGLAEYPIQVYEIYNGGDLPARLAIDDSSLDEFNAENYSSSILECLTKHELVIPPRSSVETKWKFSPLEAKTYQVDVIFKVNDTKFNLVTFRCIGFDKRKLANVASQSTVLAIPEKQKFLVPNQVFYLSPIFCYLPISCKKKLQILQFVFQAGLSHNRQNPIRRCAAVFERAPHSICQKQFIRAQDHVHLASNKSSSWKGNSTKKNDLPILKNFYF